MLHGAVLVPLQVGAPSSYQLQELLLPFPFPQLHAERALALLCLRETLRRGAARFLLKLQLYPKPLTTSETLCAHLICVISLSGEIRSSFFHWFFFFSSSEEAVLKRCLKMCCSRFCIFMQDELNAGFFFATLLFIYIYIKCIMKLNHTAQRLQFNGTHSPPVRGTTPLYTLWKIWIIILIIIKIQRKYSIFNKIVNIKQWILYLIRTSPFSSRRQSTKIYFLIWWTYNT